MSDLVEIKPWCDALEWLLVPWGHKHTGKVLRSTCDRAVDALVWSNKRPVWLPGQEAELFLVTWPDGRVVHSLGGSPSWVLDRRGHLAITLCRQIAHCGFAVQEILPGGVLVAECRGVRHG